MQILLDSTVLIDFLRGRPAVERVLGIVERGDQPATSAICVEEIIRGARVTEGESIRLLFAGLNILVVDATIARLAGTWRREHGRRGVTLAQADALIAATARQHRAPLCTGNPQDSPVTEVEVQHWPIGR